MAEKLQKGSTKCKHMSSAGDLCLLPPLACVLGLLLCSLRGTAAVRLLLIFFNWIILICPNCSGWRAIPAVTEAPCSNTVEEHIRRRRGHHWRADWFVLLICHAQGTSWSYRPLYVVRRSNCHCRWQPLTPLSPPRRPLLPFWPDTPTQRRSRPGLRMCS